MRLADEIRGLLKTYGPLTAMEIRALLPNRRADGTPRCTRSREVHKYLHAMCQESRSMREGPIARRLPDDRFQWLRDPLPPATPEERAERARLVRQRYEAKRSQARGAQRKAERRARGLQTGGRKAQPQRERDYSARQDAAAMAQSITRKQMGLRDMPDEGLPCTETWLAANADKYERLPSSGPRAVSPASRLRYTYG